MIVGEFDGNGRPRLDGHLFIERLGIQHDVWFLVDTGADSSIIHGNDAEAAGIVAADLCRPIWSRGVGGAAQYFRETAWLVFSDANGAISYWYEVELAIAPPPETGDGARPLPSLLGRTVIDNWVMEYNPTHAKLEFKALRGLAMPV